MDSSRFDSLTRTLADGTSSRRGVLKLLGGAVLGGMTVLRSGGRSEAAACRATGVTCTEHANCCSRGCGPKDGRGRRTCGCPPNQLACNGSCCPDGWNCVSDEGGIRCVPPPCAPGFEFLNDTCFLICNDGQPGPGCVGLAGNVDGSENLLCYGSFTLSGCTLTSDCPVGSFCTPLDGACNTVCGSPA